MSEYYKAVYDGKTVLVRVEQDDHPGNPLTRSDPIRDPRPLFVMSHPRYDLGDEDAVDKGWELVKKSPKFDKGWLEEDMVTFNGERVPECRLGYCANGWLDLLCLHNDRMVKVNINDEYECGWDCETCCDPCEGEAGKRGFQYRENPDYLEQNINGLFTAAQRVGFHVMPLYIYDHSGIALAMDRSYPFNCPWDSGLVGFILVTDEMLEHCQSDNAWKLAESYFNEYNRYITGDVWSICVEDVSDELAYLEKKRGKPLTIDDLDKYDLKFCARQSEVLDSCGGIYFSDDYGPEEAAKDFFSITDMEELT